MKIILHIGTHKTGTTSIQHACYNSKRTLISHGFYWAETTNLIHSTQHSSLAGYIRERNSDAITEFFQINKTNLEKAKCHTLLISGESLSHLKAEDIQYLKTFISDFDVSIIVYFRNKYDYALSALSQRIKMQESFMQAKEPISAIQRSLNYDLTISRWEKTFSPDAVKVYSYNQEKKNLIAHFSQILELKKSDDISRNINTNESENITPDFATLSFLAFTQLTAALKQYKRHMKHYDRIFSGSKKIKSPFAYKIAEHIVDSAKINYKHPKLLPFKEILEKKPEVHLSEEDKDIYLENFEMFIRKIRGKRMPFWKRLKLLFW